MRSGYGKYLAISTYCRCGQLGVRYVWQFMNAPRGDNCDWPIKYMAKPIKYVSISGSLTFILAWVFFLFLWSVPLIVTEYTIGRFTRASPVVAFYQFLGDKCIWIGSWVTAISFMIR